MYIDSVDFILNPFLVLYGTLKIAPQRRGERREDKEKEDFIFPSLFPLCASPCLCGAIFYLYNAFFIPKSSSINTARPVRIESSTAFSTFGQIKPS
jgi:hypothetical protein